MSKPSGPADSNALASTLLGWVRGVVSKLIIIVVIIFIFSASQTS